MGQVIINYDDADGPRMLDGLAKSWGYDPTEHAMSKLQFVTARIGETLKTRIIKVEADEAAQAAAEAVREAGGPDITVTL